MWPIRMRGRREKNGSSERMLVRKEEEKWSECCWGKRGEGERESTEEERAEEERMLLRQRRGEGALESRSRFKSCTIIVEAGGSSQKLVKARGELWTGWIEASCVRSRTGMTGHTVRQQLPTFAMVKFYVVCQCAWMWVPCEFVSVSKAEAKITLSSVFFFIICHMYMFDCIFLHVFFLQSLIACLIAYIVYIHRYIYIYIHVLLWISESDLSNAHKIQVLKQLFPQMHVQNRPIPLSGGILTLMCWRRVENRFPLFLMG